MSEEVTNLIAEARQILAPWLGLRKSDALQVLERLADALERSTTETREAQAKMLKDAQTIREAVDRWEADGDDERLVNGVLDPWLTRTLDRPVVSDVAEDTPKPADPKPWASPSPEGFRTAVQAAHPLWGLSMFSPRTDLGYDPDPARYGVTPTSECDECGGSGIVGSSPDAYMPCPKCSGEVVDAEDRTDDRYISRFRENPNSTGGFRD